MKITISNSKNVPQKETSDEARMLELEAQFLKALQSRQKALKPAAFSSAGNKKDVK